MRHNSSLAISLYGDNHYGCMYIAFSFNRDVVGSFNLLAYVRSNLHLCKQNYFCLSKNIRGQILLCVSKALSNKKYATISPEIVFE